MKFIKFLFLFAFISFFNNDLNAQVYYWVGGSGDWSDTAHWSNNSNGLPNEGPPTANSTVIFDANSFNAIGQTVNVNSNINVRAIIWNLDSTETIGVAASVFFNPNFQGLLATDSMKVNGSFVLHPSMTFTFNGPSFFTGGANDSIVPSGHSFGGNITIDTYGQNLTILGDINTTGNFIYKKGGLFIDNISITCQRFDAFYSGSKTLNANNTIFNLNGADTVARSKPMNSLIGSNRVFNINNSTTTNYLLIGMGGTSQNWGRLNFLNKNIRFITDSYFDTITHANSIENIEIVGGVKLKCQIFSIDGNNCRYINFKGITSTASIDNLSNWNIDFFKIQNLKCLGVAISATNTFDLGNNQNWTITEDITSSIALYWIGGQGNFNDCQNWSLTSGGTAINQVPTPNDTVYFTAPSFDIANDTLFFTEDIRVATANFSALDINIILSGGNSKLKLSKNLFGSGNLSFNWAGQIEMFGTTACTLQTGVGGNWACDINKTGTGTLTFLDNFTSSKNLNHYNGTLNTNSKTVSLFSFVSSHLTQTRNLNFLNSTFNVKGTEFKVDSTNLTTYHTTGTTFNFVADSLLTIFTPGTDSLYAVKLINGTSVQVEAPSVKYHSILDISAGSTLIMKNLSTHEFNELKAIGTCDSVITLKSNNTTYGAATLGHKPAWSNNLVVDYAIIDNVAAGLTSPYYVDNSIITPLSTNWNSGTGIVTVSVGFLIVAPNDTISPNETSPAIPSSTNLVIPANASILSSVLTLNGIQTTGATTLDKCRVSTSGASTLALLALTPPTVPTIQINTTTLPGANGLVNMVLRQVAGPAGDFIVDTAYLTVSYFIPYAPVEDTLYWYGGTGNWTDINHWSFNSGNIPPSPATCAPSKGDHVIFDNLSFNADDQSVTVDNTSYFASMTWSTIDDSVFLKMTEDLTASESVTWSPLLTINKGLGAGKFKFQPINTNANLDQNSANVDVNIEFVSFDINDTLSLTSDFDNGNFNTIILYGGLFETNDNNIHSNAFLITSAFTPTLVNLGSSTLDLIAGYADYAGDSSIVDAGTSTISVDHSSLVNTNYFKGNNQTFNRVQLNLNSNNYSVISGNNVFDSLIVGAGSKLTIDSLSNNTINSGFIMRGTCVDSIFLKSSAIGSSNYTFTSSAVLDAMCLNVRNSTATAVVPGSFTTYFSTNVTGNTGWVFDPAVSTAALLDTIYNFCYGDTVNFVNASTAFLNDVANLSYTWDFGDGYILQGDTTLHYYNYPGLYQVQLTSTYSNLCKSVVTDSVRIYAPSVSLTSSINDTLMCAEELVSFFAGTSTYDPALSLFEFIINGTAVNTPTLNFTQLDTLNLSNPSTISVNMEQNGCIVSSDTIVMDVIPLDIVTLSVPSTTICVGDVVTLTPSGSNVYKYYKNGVAITPFTALPYITTSIVNGDVFLVIGRNDSTLCSDTSNILTFTVNALPVISSFVSNDANNVICANDTVIFTVGSLTAVRYHYFLNSVLYADTTLSSFPIPNIPNGGQVNVIVENAAGCFSNISNTFVLLVNPIPNVVLTSSEPTDSVCEGTNVLFTVSNASLYQYYLNGSPFGPLSTNAFYLTDTLNNTDVISVTGSNFGCVDTSNTLVFTVINTPTTTLVSNIGNTICQGQTVILTANSAIATNYQFFQNGNLLYNGPLDTLSLSSITNGDLLSVVGSNAGCSSTDNLVINVNANPNPSIFTNDANNIICQGQNIMFTGTGGNSYQYFVNGVNSFTGAGSYTTNTLPFGNNSVYVIATNTVTGCSATTTVVNVNAIELPVTNLTVSANPICSGELVTFTASVSVADNFQFFVNSTSQGLPSSSNTFSTSTLINGAFVFVRAYNDGCPSPGLDTITMVVNPNPVATMTGSSVFCQNAAQVYTGSSNIAGSTYEFFVNGVSQSTSNTYNASGLLNGNYSLELIVTSPNACEDNVLTNISVLENPVVILSGDGNICSGEPVTFNGNGAVNYQFFVNGLLTSSTPTFTTSSLINGDIVTLTGSTGAGCASASATQINMVVSPTPNVTMISDDADNILCSGNVVNFTASGGTSYEFFVNGVSQGTPSTNAVFTTSSLSNGQTVNVQGQTSSCIDYSTPGITFSVSNSPVVSLSNLEDTTLCSDTPTQLVAGGASDYLFFVNGIPQGVFAASNNLNILLNDGDIVTVQGMTNTCVSNANTSFEFSVFSYPNTSLTSSDADNIICYGDDVTFTGSGAMQYEYFIDGLSQGISGPIYFTDDLLNGQVITLIGYNSECSTSAPQTLNYIVNTLNLSTTANPTDFMVCEGNTFDLQAFGADEYELFVNSTSQGPQSAVSNFSLNNLNDGDIITLNGYSTTTGCTQSDDQTIYIQIFQEPTITNNGLTTFCEGDSIILYSNNPIGNQWYMDGVQILGQTDSSLVVYNSGNYSLETTHGGNGELWSVGYNSNGEFGDGSNLTNMYPTPAATLTDISSISSGINHTMVVDGLGQLFIFGDNSSGQIGNGTYTASNLPVLITTLPTIFDVAAAENSSAVVTTNGELFTWGDNNEGQLGLGNTTVFNTPQWVVGMTGFTNVEAGKIHFLALKSDGTVWTAGNNDFGQLGLGTILSSNAFTQIPGLSNITKISAGDYHSMAIDNSGSLYVWGNNSSGQLGLNDLNNRTSPSLSGLDNVISVAGGNAHTLIVTNNNRVYSTGANNFGQLGTGDLTPQDSPVHLTDIDAVVEVAAGRHHSLFLKNDGTVWGSGRNDNQQLGNLPLTSITTISRVENLEGVTQIDGGNQSSHFVFGNSTTCVSAIETITVNSAPQPVISYSGGEFISSAIGVSYEWFINDIAIVNSNFQNIIPTANGDYTVSVTYLNGCVRTSEIYTYSLAGVDVLSLNTVNLSPNPTNGIFKIQWNDDIKIETITLYDLTGKILDYVTIQNTEVEFNFDISTFADGTYIVRVETENGLGKSLRVIKN